MGVTVSNGQFWEVPSGQTDIGDVVLQGGQENVDYGGTAISTGVSGGYLDVAGITISTIVSSVVSAPPA